MHTATIREAKVAAVGRRQLVLKRPCPMKSDSGRLASGRYVLTYLALLVESAVGSCLIVTSDDRCVRHVHQFACAFVWKSEGFGQHRLARLVLRLRGGPRVERADNDCHHE